MKLWILGIILGFFVGGIAFVVYLCCKKNFVELKDLIQMENGVTLESFKEMQKNKSKNAPNQISKFLFQTIDNSTNNLPVIMDTLKNNIDLSQNYLFVYINNRDIDSFVKNEYPEYYVIFRSIINSELRNNLIGVLLLYRYGGVYLKLGYKLLRPLHEIIKETDEFLSTRNIDKKLDISFFAAYPKHPVLLRYLEITMEMLIKIMDNHTENNGLFEVGSGSVPFTKAFSSVLLNSDATEIEIGTYQTKGMTVKILSNEKKLVKSMDNQMSPLLTLAYSPVEPTEPSEIFRRFNRTVDYRAFKKNMPDEPYLQKIPNFVFKTGIFELYEIPIELYRVFKETETNNPSYTFVYFSDRDLNQFVKEKFPQHCSLFKSLIPGAYRADLFRVMVLLYYGGIYLDLGNQFLRPISEIVDTSDEFVSARDRGLFDIQFAFLAAYRGHPILNHYLQRVMRNIKLKKKGKTSLSITGPTAFGKAFNSYLFGVRKQKIALGNYFIKNCKIKMFSFGGLSFNDKHALKNGTQNGYFNEFNQYIIRDKFPTYQEVVYSSIGKLNYVNLWKMNKVFKKTEQSC